MIYRLSDGRPKTVIDINDFLKFPITSEDLYVPVRSHNQVSYITNPEMMSTMIDHIWEHLMSSSTETIIDNDNDNETTHTNTQVSIETILSTINFSDPQLVIDIFDPSHIEFLTKEQFTLIVMNIYAQVVDLNDAHDINKNLSYTVKIANNIIYGFILFIIFINIFNINLNSIIIPITTIAVSIFVIAIIG